VTALLATLSYFKPLLQLSSYHISTSSTEGNTLLKPERRLPLVILQCCHAIIVNPLASSDIVSGSAHIQPFIAKAANSVAYRRNTTPEETLHYFDTLQPTVTVFRRPGGLPRSRLTANAEATQQNKPSTAPHGNFYGSIMGLRTLLRRVPRLY
jgi:hypothetical protein